MSWIPSYKKPSGGGGNIPLWSTGSDEEIAAALEAHYNDEIDLTEYWSVGDERVIHLDAMQAPNPNSSNTWGAQDITVVIVAFNHTDLETPINGHDKSVITVQTKECLNNNSDYYNQPGHIELNGNGAYDLEFTRWSLLYIRTYLNDKVWEALPIDFKASIKSSKHYRHVNYNNSGDEEVIDKIFLPSYPEIYGTTAYSNYVRTNHTEGNQFLYYETSANRIKYGNNNGSSNNVLQGWWTSSASSYYSSKIGYYWLYVRSSKDNVENAAGGFATAISPAWAM